MRGEKFFNGEISVSQRYCKYQNYSPIISYSEKFTIVALRESKHDRTLLNIVSHLLYVQLNISSYSIHFTTNPTWWKCWFVLRKFG